MATSSAPLIPIAGGRVSSVQSVASFSCYINNALLGGQVQVHGIKLEGVFLQTSQLVDTSKRVPLIDGSTAALINAVTAGTLTIRSLRVGSTIQSGDLVTIALYLQKFGDTTGSQIQFSYSFSTNGTPNSEAWYFISAIVQRVPPLLLQGNDIAEYDVVFSYDDYQRTP